MKKIEKLWLFFKGEVFQRALIAILPAYVLSNLIAISLTFLLPIEKGTAIDLAMQLVFIVYLAVVMWVFSVKRVSSLWYQMIIALMVSSLIVFACIYWGGPS